MRLVLLFLLAVLGHGISVAQESSEINRTRLSVVAGVPQLAGFEFEYVPKLWSDHFSGRVQYSYLPDVFPSSETKTYYQSAGILGYLQENGKGPYTGIGFGLLTLDFTEIDNDPIDLNVKTQWINSSIGWKFGNTIIGKIEVGYSVILFDITETNEFFNEVYGVEVNPTVKFLQLPNFTLGIGYAFRHMGLCISF